MSRQILKILNGFGPVWLWLLLMVIAEFVTFLVMTPLSYYFHGRLTDDYIVTGTVACFCACAVINTAVVYTLGVLQRYEEERERLQARLFQAQKRQAIAHLASGIAHDFNNLMAAVLGNSTWLNDALAEPVGVGTDEVRESLADIEAAARAAADLVRQLQDYARSSSPERQPLDLAPVIDEILGILARTLGPAVKVRQDVGSDLTLVGNASQLRQVLMNLCLNAADAMPDGGTLSLTAVREGDSEGDAVRVTLRDTGIGMDEQTRNQVFEPFFTTKAPSRGTGLGLAVVHGIVGSHGGQVTVDSEPGVGTTLEVSLPACDPLALTDAPAARSSRSSRGSAPSLPGSAG